MANVPKLVTITKEMESVIGSADEGTRIFRAEGDSKTYQRWWDVLAKHFPRGLVSPGGAAPYAGVSRAAVHKAMREGRVTVFAFHMLKEKRGLLGTKIVRESPYIYMPVVEMKAWGMELQARVNALHSLDENVERWQEAVRRELEGEKPDWMACFLDRPPKKKRR